MNIQLYRRCGGFLLSDLQFYIYTVLTVLYNFTCIAYSSYNVLNCLLEILSARVS